MVSVEVEEEKSSLKGKGDQGRNFHVSNVAMSASVPVDIKEGQMVVRYVFLPICGFQL